MILWTKYTYIYIKSFFFLNAVWSLGYSIIIIIVIFSSQIGFVWMDFIWRNW